MVNRFENKKSKSKASFTPSVNSKDITTNFQEYFTQRKDPRVQRTRYHLLTDIISIAILAVIAGAQGWEDIEEYGISKQEWLKHFCNYHSGYPVPILLGECLRELTHTQEVQFYITSLASDAHTIGSAIRQHWGIENSVHWTLDVTFNEDECRIRSLHSPQNFSLLRRIALNALDRESSFRRSIRQKSRRAAMNDQYMLSVLAASLPSPTLS